jgi:hypothetical protein
MAILTRNTIIGWVIRGWKPTVNQVKDLIDSLWHKQDQIPVSSVEGLEELLNGMPTQDSINSLLTALQPDIVQFEADGSYTIPGGRALVGMVVETNIDQTLSFGSSDGEADLIDSADIVANSLNEIQVFWYAAAERTIHISGITQLVTIRFFKS